MEAKSGIRPGGIGYHTVINSVELSALSCRNTRTHYAVKIRTANKTITDNLLSPRPEVFLLNRAFNTLLNRLKYHCRFMRAEYFELDN